MAKIRELQESRNEALFMSYIENKYGNIVEFDPNKLTADQVRQALGSRVAFHHTILRSDYSGMTYGGLHNTQNEAIQARNKLANQASRTSIGDGAISLDISPERRSIIEKQMQKTEARKWNEAPIIELLLGQQYHPWGSINPPYIHGIDDGTHGSTNKG